MLRIWRSLAFAENGRVDYLKRTLEKIRDAGSVSGSRESVMAGEALNLLDAGNALPWPSDGDIQKLDRVWDLKELQCAVCRRTELDDDSSGRPLMFEHHELCKECARAADAG